jgi:hypothetical protein
MALLGGNDAIEKLELQNFIDLNKTVICFDDLELCYMVYSLLWVTLILKD